MRPFNGNFQVALLGLIVVGVLVAGGVLRKVNDQNLAASAADSAVARYRREFASPAVDRIVARQDSILVRLQILTERGYRLYAQQRGSDGGEKR